MRGGGIILALIVSLVVALYVAPAFRQTADKFEGYRPDRLSVSSAPRDLKISAHHGQGVTL